jgi:hypothetical protein
VDGALLLRIQYIHVLVDNAIIVNDVYCRAGNAYKQTDRLVEWISHRAFIRCVCIQRLL